MTTDPKRTPVLPPRIAMVLLAVLAVATSGCSAVEAPETTLDEPAAGPEPSTGFAFNHNATGAMSVLIRGYTAATCDYHIAASERLDAPKGTLGIGIWFDAPGRLMTSLFNPGSTAGGHHASIAGQEVQDRDLLAATGLEAGTHVVGYAGSATFQGGFEFIFSGQHLEPTEGPWTNGGSLYAHLTCDGPVENLTIMEDPTGLWFSGNSEYSEYHVKTWAGGTNQGTKTWANLSAADVMFSTFATVETTTFALSGSMHWALSSGATVNGVDKAYRFSPPPGDLTATWNTRYSNGDSWSFGIFEWQASKLPMGQIDGRGDSID